MNATKSSAATVRLITARDVARATLADLASNDLRAYSEQALEAALRRAERAKDRDLAWRFTDALDAQETPTRASSSYDVA